MQLGPIETVVAVVILVLVVLLGRISAPRKDFGPRIGREWEDRWKAEEKARREAQWQRDDHDWKSIPSDLKTDAFTWMTRVEIVQRWRDGTLANRVAKLYSDNDMPRPSQERSNGVVE